jgi:hypothetical protein
MMTLMAIAETAILIIGDERLPFLLFLETSFLAIKNAVF